MFTRKKPYERKADALCWLLALPLFFAACKSGPSHPAMFSALKAEKTGLHFANNLHASRDFNLFRYMYFYNGAGVGAGDFNNDGLADLFFAANQEQDRLYINKGDCRFEDVTEKAKIPNDGGWSTGVSVVDINNDGLLDIYVCRVGNYEVLKGRNQLLICLGIDANGIPTYADSAQAYGLAFSGLSTQTAFFDYDLDGDLDMFLLNHAVHQNGSFRPRKEFIGTYHELSGDRLYRNELIQAGSQQSQRHFTDVTRESGINSSGIGYGLGICVSDINLDGYPDIYIGNDFHENDYLYINQRNGKFSEENGSRLMHSSQFSMGVDIADADNDGFPEIISVDMLPEDPYILKRSLGEDAYDIFHEKVRNGYNYQYARNNLQWNRRNGLFSEVGLYSGIFATDWSWAPLWFDFDNDGLKDLFISNGIPKRMNDIDYINYVSSSAIQLKIRDKKMDETDMALIDKFPQIRIPNKFFKNNGNLTFSDMGQEVAENPSTYSNGSVYADFDGDGDLDVVVSNINEPAILYRNETTTKKDSSFIEVKLKGPAGNLNAIGSKLVLFAKDGTRIYEKTAVHGFLSSMEAPLHIGVKNANIDSAFVLWPDNTFTLLEANASIGKQITVNYSSGLPVFNYASITARNKNNTTPVKDITGEVGIAHRHVENNFVEFDREPLMPHMISTEGPALAIADINGDGLDDVFIGASKREANAVFIQQRSGRFEKLAQPALEQDSSYEDVDAIWVDVNNDKKPDLVIASGGNEYYGKDINLTPRVYLNDGAGKLTRLADAFQDIFMTAGCVQAHDFNGDGAMDLFIGGRAVPWAYGQTPHSYLLQNDGTGRFKDVTAQYAPELSLAGFVTDAEWFDLDKDGDQDLVLSLQWNGIAAFINNQGTFIKKMLTERKGWWNFLLPADLDNDGDIDLVAGNLGLNSRLKASESQPVRMYYNDFDDNGKRDQIVTYYLQGKEIPFAAKSDLEKQMPVLRKRFQYAENFAKAQLPDLFTQQKLREAEKLSADYFANAILLNDGKGHFTLQALPWEAQLTPYRDAIIVDANNDNLPDVMMAGNFYANNIEMGRSDEDYGTILINRGNGSFEVSAFNGMQIKGQVRHIRELTIGNTKACILARNNDSTVVMRFDPAKR